jgi:hypothetical protein
MAKPYTLEEFEAHKAQLEAEESRQAEESRKRLAKAAYTAAGGKDSEFEKDYAELQKQERTTYLQEAARRGREAQSESRISRI